MDIVERLREGFPTNYELDAADEIERLRDDLKLSDEVRQSALQSLLATETEIARLREALRYEESRMNRIGTHSDGCHSWGPSHYECAMREIERLREALRKIADADAYDENGKPNGGGYFINLARATLGEKE